MELLRFRQIHRDYHDAGVIPGVGAESDPQELTETLLRANVNSISLFARAHHGYVYYSPTQYTRHPSLTFDLLGEQIAV